MGLRQGVDILTESFETKKYDVVVVGAGGAGLRAAIAAADYGSNVALVTKSLLGKADKIVVNTYEGSTEEVDSEGVTTAHLKVGGYEIELLEPMGKDTPVGKFIDKKGPGIHHLALEVDNIEESLAKAKKNGLEPIGEAPRSGADNTLVAFFHPKDTGGVLLEIVQEKT